MRVAHGKCSEKERGIRAFDRPILYIVLLTLLDPLELVSPSFLFLLALN